MGTFILVYSGASLRAQSSASTTSKNGFLELSGGTLYYEVAGQGYALVLIHRGQMDARMWDEQFALFSKSYRVIRQEVRGFGKSPAATAVYADEDDLTALLKHLNTGKIYVVILSLGGRIAIDFALSHPDMVAAIVPVAPGLSGFHFTDDPSFIESWRAAQAGDQEKVTDLWLKNASMAPAMENSKIAPRLHQLALENAREYLDNYLLERVLNPAAIEQLPDIKIATLIIVDNREDIHQICGLLRARVPGAKEIVIQDSGHIVNMEQPEEFDHAVLDFLNSVSH